MPLIARCTHSVEASCRMRLGSRLDLASHSLLLAAPQSVAVSAQLDCLGKVRLKHELG